MLIRHEMRHNKLHHIRASSRMVLRHLSAAQKLHRHIGKLWGTVSRSWFYLIASAGGEKMAQPIPHS